MIHKLNRAEYEFIVNLVYRESRISLGSDKESLVANRVGRRLKALKLNSFAEYCQLLRSSKMRQELPKLIDVISTNHTYFFREEKHFQFLNEVVFPAWNERYRSGVKKTVSVWSAACSSGEEPYSLAIAMEEYFKNRSGLHWELEASDISTRILAKAKRGIYAELNIKGISEDLRPLYFQKGMGERKGYFRVKDFLRDKVRFRIYNLLDRNVPFVQKFDLIVCRNVMIYFDRETQEALVKKMTGLLVPGGYLLVGHSESLGGISNDLETVRAAVYRKPE